MFAEILVAAVMSQFPTTPDSAKGCYLMTDFSDQVTQAGGVLKSTIETPSSPSIKRLIVTEFKGTREVFGAYGPLVLTPPLYIDYPDNTAPQMMVLPPPIPCAKTVG